MTHIIAHRGYAAKYPENTKIAFEAAYEQQVAGMEIDVHLTKDGEVVVCHDDTIDRTSNGTGFIKDFTVEELKAFDFAANFPVNEVYHHTEAEKILTLREYFEWARGKDLITNIEMKTNTVKYEGIEEAVNRLVVEYNQEKSVIISAFNHYSILRMKQVNPQIACGFLTIYGLLYPGQYCAQYGVEYYHPNYRMIDDLLLKDCADNQIAINAWTLNEVEDIEAALRLGVASIITDEPERAIRLKKELQMR